MRVFTFRAAIAAMLGCFGVHQAFAGELNLIDFAAKPPTALDNASVKLGDDFILTGLNSRSVTLERPSRTEESSVTYDLATPFRFEDYRGHELNLWMHVDGLAALVPGPNPFFGETSPYVVNMDLLDANGSFVYRTRATRIINRGWNELKFALIHGNPQGEHVTPDFPVHRRAFHFDRVGTPGATVTQARIRFAPSADITRIRLNSLRLKPVDRCKVVMIFDDGYKGMYDTVAGMLYSRSLKASLALIGHNLLESPDPGIMSRSQVSALYNANNASGKRMFDFLNHSYQHKPLHNETTPWTYDGLQTEIAKGANALIQLGYTRNEGYRYLVYPGGIADQQVFTVEEELGVLYGRAGGFDGDPNGVTNSIRHKYWGTGYDTAAAENGINGYNKQQSFEQLQDWLDEGVIEGSPRHLILHDVANSMRSYHVPNNYNSTAWFTKVVDYITKLRNDGKIDVVTLPEWRQGLDPLHRMHAIGY